MPSSVPEHTGIVAALDVQRSLTDEGREVLRISLYRPSLPEQGKAARLQRYLTRLTQRLQTRWEEQLYPLACADRAAAAQTGSAFVPWTAQLSYAVTYERDGLLSMRFDIREERPGHKPLPGCVGVTWDLNTGWPRTLRSLWPITPELLWRREAVRALQEDARQQLASGLSLLDPRCPELLPRVFDPERFYLTEQAICVFFPAYLLGPYAEGIPVLHLPWPEQNRTPAQAEEPAPGPDTLT